MKWNDVYLLVFGDDDPNFEETALLWKSRYRVPDTHCFKFSALPIAGFSDVCAGSFRAATLRSKIIVIAHGFQSDVNKIYFFGCGATGADFAKFLYNEAGLRQAGLISFKVCNIGRGQFLNELKCNLGLMKVGWMIGYRWRVASFDGFEVVHEIAEGDWDLFYNASRVRFYYKGMDATRVNIVQGNCNVSPPLAKSHRYRP